MKSKPTTRFCLGASAALVAALVVTVPFNMGGCGSSNINIGSLAPNIPLGKSGGSLETGKLIEGGNKFIQASSLDARHEKALGESVSLRLTNDYGVAKDDAFQHYVMFVGQAVASRTSRAGGPWVFGVLDSEKVNAFSGPGGFVWVTRGAVQQMQDESELAGVLAHEMGHVIRQHGLNAAKRAGMAEGVLEAASAEGNFAQFSNLTDKVADGIINTGFSQPEEFEADESAVRFVTAAGYDPNGLLRFLQRIRNGQKAGQNLFGTHPGLDERISRIGNQISAAGMGGHGATLRERFQQAMKPHDQAASAE
jgi:predicted Zn-dependent protease